VFPSRVEGGGAGPPAGARSMTISEFPGRARRWLLGRPRNPFDPLIHRHLALIAFFAWVGLGSDGLSSSSYGPEELYRALGAHPHLALYLAFATMATVFLISASYMQVIERFPSGGGGYLVASALLGPVPGVISGCALVVDYVLTISISVAAGCDAIFSFLPASAHVFILPAEFAVLLALVLLNLRGVKETVVVLTPIFLLFVLTHVGLIVWGIARHAGALHPMLADTVRDTRLAVRDVGLLGVLAVMLRAFSLGGGTYTGIEAVSNGVGILREPRVANGRKTMLYMATSLAFTAGGILLCYLLARVHVEPGRTLNASLWTALTSGWQIGSFQLSGPIVGVTLLSEGALLFVAAQTGFLDGPRTLAAMAADAWVPRKYAHLSERLVTQNGILTMGVLAAVVLAYTRGAVTVLVVMYSINVFLTFTLSQVGMARYWIANRRRERHVGRRLAVNAVGAVVTGTILAVTVTTKFREGGWITLLATTAVVAVCFGVRRHYERVKRHLALLDRQLENLPLPDDPGVAPPLAPHGPTAILLVESYNGLGIHTVLSIQQLWMRHFRNFVFVSVGHLDSSRFRSAEEVQALEAEVRSGLERYVRLAQCMGAYATARWAVGTDTLQQLEELCADASREFRHPIVFAGQLVFEREGFFTRLLHHDTSSWIQRRLQFLGIQVIVLPIRMWDMPRRLA
jgi:amino acid transporter